MKDPKYFIVIDDDAINNKICRTVIEKIYVDAEVQTFTDPILGFEYIVAEYSKSENTNNAILFLDINMPVMDAWEFLNLFDRLEDNVRNKITIFMLSSSVNKSDMERAMSNRNVSYYLIKPLTKESIKLITNLSVKKKMNTETQPISPETSRVPMFDPYTGAPLVRNQATQKIDSEERESQLRIIKLKDELVHREIPELEKNLNELITTLEKKHKNLGLYIEPLTVNSTAYDKKKAGKLQLSIHFFDPNQEHIHIIHDSTRLGSL